MDEAKRRGGEGAEEDAEKRDFDLKRKMTKVLPANFTTDFADFD